MWANHDYSVAVEHIPEAITKRIRAQICNFFSSFLLRFFNGKCSLGRILGIVEFVSARIISRWFHIFIPSVGDEIFEFYSAEVGPEHTTCFVLVNDRNSIKQIEFLFLHLHDVHGKIVNNSRFGIVHFWKPLKPPYSNMVLVIP